MAKNLTYGKIEESLTLLYIMGEDDEISDIDTVEELIEVLENNCDEKVEDIEYLDLAKALTQLYTLGEDDEISDIDTVEELIKVLENNREKVVEI